MSVKWRYLLMCTSPNQPRRSLKIDQSKREKELKQLILASAKELTVWIDNATKVAEKGEESDGMSDIERTLTHIMRYRENEGQHYNKLIQMIGHHTELCLIAVNEDVEEIVSSIEQKWLNWLSVGRAIERSLESKLEYLLVNEERKKLFISITSEADWYELCLDSLDSQVEIQTRAKLLIEHEKYTMWTNFVETQLPLQRT